MAKNSGNSLSGQVSAVTAHKGGAIDGSAPVPQEPPRPRPPREPPRAPDLVRTDNYCPRCGQVIPHHFPAHLLEEMAKLEARLPLVEGMHAEEDSSGHILVYGPDGDPYPAMWARFGELLVDPNVQRDLIKGHDLLRQGSKLDLRKTEAITVVPVDLPDPENAGQEKRYYRVLEGQHRVALGQLQAPEALQLCKVITDLESWAQEAWLARTMASSRSNFKSITDWYALLVEQQPNVVLASAFLSRGLPGRGGYIVAASTTATGGKTAVPAAGTMLQIIGMMKTGSDYRPMKLPTDGVADLEAVMTMLEGIADEDGEGSIRYNSVLMRAVYRFLQANQGMDVQRFAKGMGTRTAKSWLKLRKESGARYMLFEMAEAYKRGLPEAKKKSFKVPS
jgi:hypothetical protein